MSIFCNIYLVVKINNWYCRKFYEKFQLTTPYWSMISSLLHLVGLRPRVYYTITNFRGGGAKAPLAPPLNTPMACVQLISLFLFEKNHFFIQNAIKIYTIKRMNYDMFSPKNSESYINNNKFLYSHILVRHQ